MKKKKIILLLSILLVSFLNYSQDYYKKNSWLVSIDFGVQMSGIKSEDFVSSNYSPVYRLSTGKWLNNFIGIQIGYQGRYFNTIENSEKRFYNFYFIEGILDVKNILKTSNSKKKVHELILHGGFGYFQNQYYENSSIYSVLGISNNFLLTNKINLKIDVGAIIGWDIYQGDQDILPNSSIGLIYQF
tara:strand:- start:1777 stop:2337 length:561 start_codon:yes stop_codon:yes gene_type:complete